MTEHPIVFTGPSITQIRAGTKVQSRRLLKLDESSVRLFDTFDEWTVEIGDVGGYGGLVHRGNGTTTIPIRSPFGRRGDRLWVRETHAFVDELCDGSTPDDPMTVAYKVDHEVRAFMNGMLSSPFDTYAWNWKHPSVKWRSPRFMPRWASRMLLELTGLRVQAVQSISEADAKAEGVPPFNEAYECISPDQRIVSTLLKDRERGEQDRDFRAGDSPYRASFAVMWDEMHAERRVRVPRPWPRVNEMTSEIDTSASWPNNPIVLVLDFRLVTDADKE